MSFNYCDDLEVVPYELVQENNRLFLNAESVREAAGIVILSV
jgi:hypothetical protein